MLSDLYIITLHADVWLFYPVSQRKEAARNLCLPEKKQVNRMWRIFIQNWVLMKKSHSAAAELSVVILLFTGSSTSWLYFHFLLLSLSLGVLVCSFCTWLLCSVSSASNHNSYVNCTKTHLSECTFTLTEACMRNISLTKWGLSKTAVQLLGRTKLGGTSVLVIRWSALKVKSWQLDVFILHPHLSNLGFSFMICQLNFSVAGS